MGDIAIKLDSPYKPKIEKINEFNNSLFQESYKTACKSVRDIISLQPTAKGDYAKENSLSLYVNSNMIYNIVPFIGERGSGKTSVMLSFREYLKGYPSGRLRADAAETSNEFDLGNANRFITLEPIDVGHFEKNEDLFGVVLARMLAYYNHLLDENHNMVNANTRSLVYSNFSDIYKDLVNIGISAKDSDLIGRSALKVLQDLDASQNLKASFMKLVKKFIQAVNEFKLNGLSYDLNQENTYIVISIDDLDMNIANAHKMMEQLQSYMMIPNVIVLLTANYDNLMCICMNHYASFFKETIHATSRAKNELDKRFLDSCENLAHEYLDKFLPTGKIVHLIHPHNNDLLIEIEPNQFPGILRDNGENPRKILYSYMLRAIIFCATGIYMYANNEKPCFLEPKSIRAKAQYIHKIKNLEPVLKSRELKKSEICVSQPEYGELKDFILKTKDNAEKLCKDISIRHVGTFPETRRKRLKSICELNLRDINNAIYFASVNIHEIGDTKSLLPWSYNNVHRDTYVFSHVIDVLDTLEKISDPLSYKDFINTATGIFTAKLVLEKYTKLEQRINKDGKNGPFIYSDTSAEIEYELFQKYIGKSFFGWLDNQLVRPMPKNIMGNKPVESPYLEQDTGGNELYIGFAMDITTVYDLTNENNTGLDTDRIHAFALFIMFLSQHSYSIELDYPKSTTNNKAVTLKVNFSGNVDFAVSSFFINICKPKIIIDFYLKILEHAVESGCSDKDLTPIADQLVCALRQLFASVDSSEGDKCSDIVEIAKDITSAKIIKGLRERQEDTIAKQLKDLADATLNSIVPILNVNFMYNIMREVRKDVKKSGSGRSAWESYCKYFKFIHEEFENIDKDYSKIAGYEQKQLSKRFEAIMPTYDSNEKSFFYLNTAAHEYFNTLITNIVWQNDTLQRDKHPEEGNKNDTNHTDDNDDFR